MERGIWSAAVFFKKVKGETIMKFSQTPVCEDLLAEYGNSLGDEEYGTARSGGKTFMSGGR